jgi:hypothetical protein
LSSVLSPRHAADLYGEGLSAGAQPQQCGVSGSGFFPPRRSQCDCRVHFSLAGSPAAFGQQIAGDMCNAAHSYTAAFDLSAGQNLMALLLLLLLKKPQRTTPR